jgi:beta-N-acetylhexosaminidase
VSEAFDSSLLLAFDGLEPPGWVMDRLDGEVNGFTLFGVNIESAAQVAAVTKLLHGAGALPRLIATDQEGGQLNAFGDGTPFAGNMALGAVGDSDLARRVGRATGQELRSVGITVDYAPVCDVASRPGNPSLGIRSFGENPIQAAALAAAMVGGLQAGGVAAVLKHFPGKGEAEVDPHYELPVLDLDRERFDQVEFPPFQAGIAAGARIVMMGHYASPRLTGRRDLPASLSSVMVDGVLRGELGFEGVVITDALDMGAVQSEGGVEVAAAIAAGVDLLLCGRDPEAQQNLRERLAKAAADGRITTDQLAATRARLDRLRRWLATLPVPGVEVIRSAEHLAIAEELARRSITLVRNEERLLPLRPGPEDRILVIVPETKDLTPADTSSREKPGDHLVAALRARHARVELMTLGHSPAPPEVAAVIAAAAESDVIVAATMSANPGQAALIDRLANASKPLAVVALRTPDDLSSFPHVRTYICSYGVLPPSIEALVAKMMGEGPYEGRLPVSIPGLYPAGHGLTG